MNSMKMKNKKRIMKNKVKQNKMQKMIFIINYLEMMMKILNKMIK